MSPLARWCHRHRLAVVPGPGGPAAGDLADPGRLAHANRVMAELSARDRTQLVAIAYETGLVRAGELQE